MEIEDILQVDSDTVWGEISMKVQKKSESGSVGSDTVTVWGAISVKGPKKLAAIVHRYVPIYKLLHFLERLLC